MPKKYQIIFTASREMTKDEIKEEFGNDMELDDDDDPVEKFVEHINDNGIGFFADQEMTVWDHSVDSKEVKSKDKK